MASFATSTCVACSRQPRTTGFDTTTATKPSDEVLAAASAARLGCAAVSGSFYPENYGRTPPEAAHVERLKFASRRTTLVVGGERHEVLWHTLNRLPNSRLGRLQRAATHEQILECCDDYSLG